MSSYGDGSSEALATIMLAGIGSLVLLVVFGICTWLHVRSESRKDAACESRGGVRISADGADYCIRKGALIDVTGGAT